MIPIRLSSHLFVWFKHTSPEHVVRHFGCLQAQDSNRAKRVIGSRVPWSTLDDINKAIAQKKIVRTWPMRGTLHYMAPEYVHMMLDLCAVKTLPWFAKRREFLGISDAYAEKALKIMEKKLSGGNSLTRSQLWEELKLGWIPMQTQRVYHLACYAATRKLICFWPKDEKEDSFVLLDERLPKSPTRTEEESLGELARMYIRSHGPATVDDLAWWTALPKGICKQAISLVEKEFEMREVDGKKYYYIPQKSKERSSVHLLGWFDEYFIWYKDRSIVADIAHHKNLFTSNGIFFPTILIDGRVVGTWKRVIKKWVVLIDCTLLWKLDASHKKILNHEWERSTSFLWEKEFQISFH